MEDGLGTVGVRGTPYHRQENQNHGVQRTALLNLQIRLTYYRAARSLVRIILI